GSAVMSKASIELAAFKKTGVIEPGAKERVTLTYNINDMASYDDEGVTGKKSAYVLEAGTYDILVGNSVKNNAKQGEYIVDTITVTEQLSKYGEVTLEERSTGAPGKIGKTPAFITIFA
ncbi:MAG: fibronectin type III-like domain-contianing protein, partial [Lentisphaeria bacterium]|nr:fibronectin type III-like domain-contianing protein [Lentisphaeria bacterium]